MHGVDTEVLCVVNAYNVRFPQRLYRFFKKRDVRYLTFLPLVEPQPGSSDRVSDISVPAAEWGRFLCDVFDEWLAEDIGRIKVQIFEEALRTAFGQEHSLCIFRPVCGDVPILEHNGDLYQCDHFVDEGHLLGNIGGRGLAEMLEDPRLRTFGEAKLRGLPHRCIICNVRDMCNGECPKNRLLLTPDGEPGLNYLCSGYKSFFTHCEPFVSKVASLWKWRGRSAPNPR
jgi:uncharacterized protein